MAFTASWTLPQLGAVAFGTVAIGYGVRGILTPFEFARDFGLPQSVRVPTNPFIATTGGRTAALGVAIISLSLLGNIKASGIVLMSCAVSGLTDAAITYLARNTGAVIQHGIGTLFLASFGWYLTASE